MYSTAQTQRSLKGLHFLFLRKVGRVGPNTYALSFLPIIAMAMDFSIPTQRNEMLPLNKTYPTFWNI